MARVPRPAGSEQDDESWTPSDEDLGVGVETPENAKADAAIKIAAVMEDPIIATAIEQLVQKRVAELAMSNGAPQAMGADMMAKSVSSCLLRKWSQPSARTPTRWPSSYRATASRSRSKRSRGAPGLWSRCSAVLTDITRRYWTAVERSDHMEAERLTPVYILDEDFFGPGEVGNEMYVRGETIRWFGVPGIYMEPRNGVAKELCELMWTYLGNEGAPSAEDLAVKASQMMRPSTPGGNPARDAFAAVSARPWASQCLPRVRDGRCPAWPGQHRRHRREGDEGRFRAQHRHRRAGVVAEQYAAAHGSASGTWRGRVGPNTLKGSTMKFRTTFLGAVAALALFAGAAQAQPAGFQFPSSPWNAYAPTSVTCGWLYGANMNVTTRDQAITISVPSAAYTVEAILVSNPSVSLTTAAGGFYSAVSKGGVIIVAAAQAYSALTTKTANTTGNQLSATISTAGATTNFAAQTSTGVLSTIYLSLTTGQGAAATADVRVLCRPLY